MQWVVTKPLIVIGGADLSKGHNLIEMVFGVRTTFVRSSVATNYRREVSMH